MTIIKDKNYFGRRKNQIDFLKVFKTAIELKVMYLCNKLVQMAMMILSLPMWIGKDDDDGDDEDRNKDL